MRDISGRTPYLNQNGVKERRENGNFQNQMILDSKSKLEEIRAESAILERKIKEGLQISPELNEDAKESSDCTSYLSFEETRKFNKEGSGSIGLTDRLGSLREKERLLKQRLRSNGNYNQFE